MLRRPQFCAMPQPVQGLSPRLAGVADSCQWLVSQQKFDGSWGDGQALDKLVCTNHVTMTLLVAGFSAESNPVKKAVAWLTGSAAHNHTNSYWILGPLAGLDRVPASVKERELRMLEQILKSGAKPHADQLVEAYYLRALNAAGLAAKDGCDDWALNEIIRFYDPAKGWFNRVDSTTDGYAALFEFAPEKAAELREAVEQFVIVRAQADGEGVIWGSQISTAYSLMNIVSTDLIENDMIRDLVMRAAAALEATRQSDRSWNISSRPYGGAGDLVSREYPTAVMTRALMAAESVIDTSYLGNLAGGRVEYVRARLRRRARFLWATLALFILAFVTSWDETAWSFLIEGSWLAETWRWLAGIFGVLAALFGFWARFEPERARELWRRVREWLQSF